MKQAQIKCRDKRFPFGLRVQVSDRGVRFDRTDSAPEGKSFLVLNASTESARKLAQWILDNTEAKS